MTATPREGGDLAVRVEPTGKGAFALLAETRSDWEAVRPTRATLHGPDGHRLEVALAPAGPGRYRAQLASLPAGAYIVQVEQALAGGATLRGEAGWVAPYPSEYRATGVDHAALARIAAAGGGRVLADAREAVAPPTRPASARWPLWPLLLAAAAIAWPLEIASRRLSVPLPSPPLARRPPRAQDRLGTPPPQPPLEPAESTMDRLLERKKALRSDQHG